MKELMKLNCWRVKLMNRHISSKPLGNKSVSFKYACEYFKKIGFRIHVSEADGRIYGERISKPVIDDPIVKNIIG